MCRRCFLGVSGCLLLVLSSLPDAAGAQRVPEQRLSRPDVTHPHQFSSIRGFLELADGRVLVSDGIDETLLRFSMSGGKVDTVGRAGQGPGEYKQPDRLMAMPGNGVLLMDLGNARLTRYDRNLAYVESKSIARGAPPRGLMMVLARDTDSRGGIYFEYTPFSGASGPPDSAKVLRYDPAAETFDTVGSVKREEVKVTSSGSGQNRNVSMRMLPLSPRDAWAVGLDGRLAIARASDYRVEWVLPGGRIIKGPANAWKPVPIRQAEKEEWVGESSDGLAVAVSNDNGQMSVTLRRGGMRMGGQRAPDTSNQEWPEAKPPFVTNGVWVSPEGDAWVERSVPAGAGQTFDIFGRDATLTRRVILPEGRRLIGFGQGVIYTRRANEDDLQILERFRLR